jgi:TolB-like protein/tetratricopeptide (TPR) repeat protein
MALKPGERVGSFEVLSSLGVGGMGEVYRVRDARLGREVAIKILPDEFSRDAQRLAGIDREARVLASLNHPNIAALYGLEESRGIRYLVMEMVPGETLAERVRHGPLPLGEAVDVCRQIAEALEVAHTKGVIHCDLKPANIKITPEGRVKVLDFGLAVAATKRSESDSSDSPTVTKDASLGAGTPAYMSPEQARGQALDTRTDIWSFGCVLYETLTALRAFPGKTTADTLAGVLEREPDWGALSATTPPKIRSLIDRCTRKDRSRRLHDIADARIELQDALAGAVRDVSAEPSGPAGSRPGRWTAAALAGFLALAGGSYLLQARRSSRAEGSRVPGSLAVLPFHVVTVSGSDQELGVGIADDIITHLANIEDLRVRPTQSVVHYQGSAVDVQEAGRALKADSVLTGAVRKMGNGLRVSVQLVRVADGASFWAESYDLPRAELPGVEDRISEKVIAALGVRVTAAERARIYRRYTANAVAYEGYLRGRGHLARSTEEGMLAAVKDFEEVLRLDPNYALAYAGLSIASAEMHLRFAPEAEVQAWGERAKREGQRAVNLDANVAETHVGLAAVYGKAEFEWDRVIAESRRALELNPRLEPAHVQISRAFSHLGLLDAADESVRQALALDPENRIEPVRSQAVTALFAGRFDEAVRLLEETQRISGRPLTDTYLAQAYFYNGETTRAETALARLSRATSAAGATRARATLASFLAARGERSDAENLVRQVTAGGYTDHHVAYSLGAAYAQLGQAQDAVSWLRRAAGTGFPCYPWYARDRLLAPLRGHPEFQRLMQELQAAQREAQERYAPG